MQNFNFFQWVREGVKQSVLLGVSDAIETIGSPDDRSTLHPNVAALLGSNNDASPSRRSSNLPNAKAGAAGRKRLGKSLKDIEPQA